jgi:hypothetical protein
MGDITWHSRHRDRRMATMRTQVGIPEEAQQPVIDAAEEVGHGGRPGSANDSGWLSSACAGRAMDGCCC